MEKPGANSVPRNNPVSSAERSPAGTPADLSAAFYLVVLFQQLLGGLTFPMAKIGLGDIEPFTFAFYRFTISALIFIILVRVRHPVVTINRGDRWKIFGLGLLIIPFNQALYLVGQSMTGAGHGALIFATAPLWIFLGGMIFLREPFRIRRGIGVFLGMAGVFSIVWSGAQRMGRGYMIGDLIILVAVIAWAAYTVLARPLVMRYGAFRVTAYALFAGSLCYFPFGLVRATHFDHSAVTTGAWLSLLYVAIGTSVVAYTLWFWLLKQVEANRMALFQNIQPVLGTAAAAIILGETFGWSFIIGGLIVLTGLVIAEWPDGGGVRK